MHLKYAWAWAMSFYTYICMVLPQRGRDPKPQPNKSRCTMTASTRALYKTTVAPLAETCTPKAWTFWFSAPPPTALHIFYFSKFIVTTRWTNAVIIVRSANPTANQNLVLMLQQTNRIQWTSYTLFYDKTFTDHLFLWLTPVVRMRITRVTHLNHEPIHSLWMFCD